MPDALTIDPAALAAHLAAHIPARGIYQIETADAALLGPLAAGIVHGYLAGNLHRLGHGPSSYAVVEMTDLGRALVSGAALHAGGRA